jgi:hypothetical protein
MLSMYFYCIIMYIYSQSENASADIGYEETSFSLSLSDVVSPITSLWTGFVKNNMKVSYLYF